VLYILALHQIKGSLFNEAIWRYARSGRMKRRNCVTTRRRCSRVSLQVVTLQTFSNFSYFWKISRADALIYQTRGTALIIIEIGSSNISAFVKRVLFPSQTRRTEKSQASVATLGRRHARWGTRAVFARQISVKWSALKDQTSEQTRNKWRGALTCPRCKNTVATACNAALCLRDYHLR